MLQDSYSSFRIQIAKWLRSMSAVVFWCVMVSSEPRYDMYPPQLTEFWDLENSGRAGECIKYHKVAFVIVISMKCAPKQHRPMSGTPKAFVVIAIFILLEVKELGIM
eukprot:m.214679 g.214679  ORF g.214679 m.214679 type:complete len:107 (-) comp15871_c0_seq6:1862-2182(-)